MQVYRYMDIGTAKVTLKERGDVPHHLIDIVNPDGNYDAQSFVTDTLAALNNIHANKKIPIITGGTGLYLKSLTEGLFDDIGEYPDLRKDLQRKLETEGRSKLHEELLVCDSVSAQRIHKNDTHRLLRALEIYYGTGLSWSEHLRLQKSKREKERRFHAMLQLGLTCDRKTLYERINLRTSLMMEAGLIEEVSKLLAMGFNENLKSMSSIGYRHAINLINNKWTREETETFLARDTRRYAKRQYTWFSKIQDLQWFEISHPERVLDAVSQWLTTLSY